MRASLRVPLATRHGGVGAGSLPALGGGLRLLLASARAAIDPRYSVEVESLLADAVDWTELVRLALAHGMTPLLVAGLRGATAASVPADIREALELHWAGNADRTAALIRELFALLAALKGRGVRALPFKGPTLAELAFGDASLRRAGDLDLLVRPEALAETCRVLAGAGYRESVEHNTGKPMSGPENAAYLRYQCEYLFVRPRDGFAVEPHWALAPPNLALSLDHDGFWDRARPRSFHGGEVWSLALEDLLLALCVHATKHDWEELRWTADVAALLHRHADLDVELALERARRQHAERILLLGLYLARALLGARLPAPVEGRLLQDVRVQELAGEVVARLVRGGPRPPSIFELSRFRLRMRERRRDRICYVLRTLTTPQMEHVRTLPLPARLFFLYPAVKLAHDYAALPLWKPAKRAWRSGRRALRARGSTPLLVVDWVPHIREGAGLPRMNALLGLLGRQGYAVTLHPVQPCTEPDADLYSDVPAEVEVVRERGLDRIDEFLLERARHFGTVLVSRPQAMRTLAEVFERSPALRTGLRVIYDAEAIFALREIRRRSLLGDPLDAEAARRSVAEECRLAACADAVIATSAGEAETFRGHGAKEVFVLPHVVRARPTPRPFAERRGLLFVGRLAEDGWPNADGLGWFLDRVFDRVRSRLREHGPGPMLRVAGLTGARRLAECVDPAVQILGVACDLQPLFDEARVFVAPIRYAAGVPIKVYEAAAHGLPVVATQLLADQLGWQPGRDLLTAEASDPAAFADRVVELYTRPELWARLRESALARVALECSPERAERTMDAALGGGRRAP